MSKGTNYAGFGHRLKQFAPPNTDNILKLVFTGRLTSGKTMASQYVLDRYPGIKIAWADELKLETYDFLALRDTNTGALQEIYEAMTPDVQAAFQTAPYSSHVLPKPAQKIAWINANKNALRVVLQWWGTEFRRAADHNYWVNKGSIAVDDMVARGQLSAIVNDDTRFPNELDAMRQRGFIHIRILVDDLILRQRIATIYGYDDATIDTILSHPSETSIDQYPADYIVHNDGTVSEFYQKLEQTLIKILTN